MNKYIIICIGFLFSLSYLIPNTSYIFVSFYKEILSLLGLFLIILVLSFKKISLTVSKSFLILFLLSVIPIVQYFCGKIFFLQDAFFASIYILIFLVSILTGRALFDLFRNKAIQVFAILLIIIGILSVCVIFNQFFCIFDSPYLYKIASGQRAYANLGQPNQLSTLLFMSLLSIFYLYDMRKLSKVSLIFSSVFIVFGIASTLSRTGWLSILILSAIFFIFKSKNKFFIRFLVSLNIIYFLLWFSISDFFKDAYGSYSRTQLETSRLDIWYQMFLAIINKPFTGWGWLQTSIVQVNMNSIYPVKREWFTYTHNIFLDFIVWNGIPLAILFIFPIIIFFTKTCTSLKRNQRSRIFLFTSVVVFFIHSCLEYPYAYLYFLIPIGLFIGCLIQSGGERTFASN